MKTIFKIFCQSQSGKKELVGQTEKPGDAASICHALSSSTMLYHYEQTIVRDSFTWTIDDVMSRYECTVSQAELIMERLTNHEWLCGHVNEQIDTEAEELGLTVSNKSCG